MKWKKDDFYNFILKQRIIGFFQEPIKLKSGRYSSWYVNWRTVAEDVQSIDTLSKNFRSLQQVSSLKSFSIKPPYFF